MFPSWRNPKLCRLHSNRLAPESIVATRTLVGDRKIAVASAADEGRYLWNLEVRGIIGAASTSEEIIAARAAYTAFERAWAKRCPGVVTSLREGGNELLTFFIFSRSQWKALRSTNVIERLHEEFRRRVKTQGSLPSEDTAIVLLFSLVVSGQIKLRRIDGGQKIAAVLSQHAKVAA